MKTSNSVFSLCVAALSALLAGCPATLGDWSVAAGESVSDAPDGQSESGLEPEVTVDGSPVGPAPDVGVDEIDVTAVQVDSGSPVDATDSSIVSPVADAADVEAAPTVDSACAPVTHTNGVGQSWQDCVPVGTYSAEQAIRACAAATGDAAKCEVVTTCPAGIGIVDSGYSSYFWEYAGPLAGRVFPGQAGCMPMSGTSAWD